MAPHSSTLAWKIPWTEEPGRLWSMGQLNVFNSNHKACDTLIAAQGCSGWPSPGDWCGDGGCSHFWLTCLERSEGSTCITNIHPKNAVNSYFPLSLKILKYFACVPASERYQLGVVVDPHL